jgi:hypothetical protein
MGSSGDRVCHWDLSYCRTSAFVQVFGTPAMTTAPRSQAAGVLKAPRHEVADRERIIAEEETQLVGRDRLIVARDAELCAKACRSNTRSIASRNRFPGIGRQCPELRSRIPSPAPERLPPGRWISAAMPAPAKCCRSAQCARQVRRFSSTIFDIPAWESASFA